MTLNSPATTPFAELLRYRTHFALHQALCAIAKFGVPDAVERGLHDTSALSRELSLNENALHRTLRALAGQGIFQEVSTRFLLLHLISDFATPQELTRGIGRATS